MEDTTLTHRPVAAFSGAGERGFVAGLLGATFVVLTEALVRLLVSGAESGDYDLDFASALSIFVIAIGVVGVSMILARRARLRAREEHVATEVEIARAERLIAELQGKSKRG